MKKLTALVALALIVIGASQFVATGGAAQESSIKTRVAALEKKVRGLQLTTNSLKKQTGILAGFAGCLAGTPIPIARYSGYVYTPDHGTTLGETTALDATDTGDTPQAYIVTINPSCLGSSAAKGALMRQGWATPRVLLPRARR